MMKSIALVVGLMIVSSPAFATRARLEALGEDKNGSFYVKDNRNIFLNPAQINYFKKQITLEFGGDTSGTESAAASKGQGGFTNTAGDFTYGIYLGNESDKTASVVAGANAVFGALGTPTIVSPDKTVDVFFGGDAGVKWGANVFYAGSENQVAAATDAAPTQTSSQVGARLGAEMDDLAVFTTVAISTKAASTGDTAQSEAKGKIGINAGVTYGLGDFTVFGKFNTRGVDISTGTIAGSLTKIAEVSIQEYGVGFGYQKEVAKGVSMFARSGVEMFTQVTKNGSGTETAKASQWNVPVVIGAEAEALSWLMLRGSVSQSLIGQNMSGNSNRDNFINTRTVSAGTTFKFGPVNVDAVVAGATAPTINGNPGTAGSPSTDGTFGFGNNMLYRVATTYNF
jgi:hypothetical protein